MKKLREKEEQLLSGMFIISTGDESTIEQNCEELDLVPNWDLINKDIQIVENNIFSILKKSFGGVRGEGHDKYNDLIGSLYLNGNETYKILYNALDISYDDKTNTLIFENIEYADREIFKGCSEFGAVLYVQLSIHVENPSALYLKEFTNFL